MVDTKKEKEHDLESDQSTQNHLGGWKKKTDGFQGGESTKR